MPPAEADVWAARLAAMEGEIEAVLEEEKEEKILNIAERDIKKGENLVVHEGEIKSRPRRTWFESEKEKKEAKDKGRVALNGEGVLGKKTKKKLSGKEKKKLDIRDERRDVKTWKKGKKERDEGGVRAGGNKGKSNGLVKGKGKKVNSGSSKKGSVRV